MRVLFALMLVLAVVLFGVAQVSKGPDGTLDGAGPMGEVGAPTPTGDRSSLVLPSEGGDTKASVGRKERSPAVTLPTHKLVTESPAGPKWRDKVLVRVLNARGEPAPGIVVLLRGERSNPLSNTGFLTSESREPDGHVSFGLLEQITRMKAMDDVDRPWRFFVEARLPTSEPVSVEVSVDDEGSEPVDLILPSLGTLEVHVTHADGTPLGQNATLSGSWVSEEEAARRPGVQGEAIANGLAVGASEVIRFDPVGLGLRFSFTAKSRGFLKGTLINVAGPSREGETLRIELPLGQSLSVIRGRLLGLSGEPLVDTSVKLIFFRLVDATDPDRRPVLTIGRRTDAQAAFRLPMDFGKGFHVQVVYQREGVPAQKDPNWSTGSFIAPPGIPSGTPHDVGTIRMKAVPTLAHGRVVDGAGKPVASARLRFEHVWGDGPDERLAFGSGLIYSEPDGSFRFRATRTVGRLGVAVSAKGFDGLWESELPADGSAVELRLRRTREKERVHAGSISIEIEADGLGTANRLGLTHRDPEGKVHTINGRGHSVGEPRVYHLPVGTHDIQVTSRDGGWVVREVKGVEIRAGEVTKDARLLPLDVTGDVRHVSLRIVLPSGRPVRGPTLEVFEPAAGIRFQCKGDREGVCRFLVPVGAHEIQVGLDGGEAISLPVASAADPPQAININRFSPASSK